MLVINLLSNRRSSRYLSNLNWHGIDDFFSGENELRYYQIKLNSVNFQNRKLINIKINRRKHCQ